MNSTKPKRTLEIWLQGDVNLGCHTPTHVFIKRTCNGSIVRVLPVAEGTTKEAALAEARRICNEIEAAEEASQVAGN
ncbi:MAG TPA: hypothetical protein VIM11_15505 [Tepidisphaeraceae bacterium]|jgi:hypothetical protein